ncbi:MAG: hypothetical protein QOC55_2612 [Thermoleophilaceae bacterium]|jgi:hypothetical protein|nr:hypothetical protein [Thermoleophilaceae bacterium]
MWPIDFFCAFHAIPPPGAGLIYPGWVHTTPESEEELKTKECTERQEEMDAIAAYGTRGEFPPVSGTFVRQVSDDVAATDAGRATLS